MAMNLETVLKIRADVTGDNEIKGLNDKLKKSATNAGSAATGFNKLKASASGAIGAMRGLLPVIGVAGLAAFAKSNLDAADAMSKLSDRTGIAAPRLDQFRKVAELSDTSIESLGRAFPALTANMDTAAQKAKGPAFEAFERLGVSVKDVDGGLRDADAVMLDVADKFSTMANGAEKSALASDLFGSKLGSELIPLLNSGGEAVRNMGTALTQEFADDAAAFNDKIEDMQEKFGDLALELTKALLPVLENLVGFLGEAINVFTGLPGPVQNFILAFGGLAAVAAVFAPLVLAITSLGPAVAAVAAAAGPVLTGIVALLTGPVGLAIAIGAVLAAVYIFRDDIGAFFVALGEQIAGFVGTLYDIFVQPFVDTFNEVVALISDAWASVSDLLLSPFSSFVELLRDEFITPLIDFLTGATDTLGGSWAALGEILAAPFKATLEFVDSNFVKPILSAISSAVDSLKQFWGNLTEGLKRPFQDAFNFINDNFAEPVKGIIEAATIFVIDSWQAVQEGLTAPFTAAAEIIKGVLNSVIGSVENTINSVIKSVNSLIRGVNSIAGAVGLPAIRTIKTVNLPRFADGGVVNGPTMAIVGEGGQPEYIIPASKADGFAANWMSGIRGPAAIPRFAEGGMVAPSNANVSIQTGPVTQMNGSNYVTTQDMSAAVQAGVKQTLDLIRRDGNVRSSLGIA